MKLTIPHNFKPRDYQLPLLQAIDSGYKRLIYVWHRRAGKDKVAINIIAKKMLERVGAYFYIFPTYMQGKKIIWNGMDKEGFRFMDHIPQDIRKRTDNTEMFVELVNGSTFQIIGSDNIDSIVGSNPTGVVFSEYSLQDPRAWDFIRPILAENEGFAIFNFTPRGKNHAYDLLEYAKTDPSWFLSVLTAENTGAIKPEVLEQERKEILQKNGDDAIYQQEYFCSFNAGLHGNYYSKLLDRARQDGRIKKIPYDLSLPVDTWWDLGVGDSTSIWFTQMFRDEIRVIDFMESEGEGIAYYIQELQSKGYVYGSHYWPHDGDARELTTGVSRRETAEKLGLRPINIVERLGIDDGIQATRNLLSKCFFDEEKCAQGLKALNNYHKEYDEKRKTFKNHPDHDWSSHASDAFRSLGVGYGQYKNFNYGSSRSKKNLKNRIKRAKHSAVI